MISCQVFTILCGVPHLLTAWVGAPVYFLTHTPFPCLLLLLLPCWGGWPTLYKAPQPWARPAILCWPHTQVHWLYLHCHWGHCHLTLLLCSLVHRGDGHRGVDGGVHGHGGVHAQQPSCTGLCLLMMCIQGVSYSHTPIFSLGQPLPVHWVRNQPGRNYVTNQQQINHGKQYLSFFSENYSRSLKQGVWNIFTLFICL